MRYALIACLLAAACNHGRPPPEPLPERGECELADAKLRELDCRQSSGDPWYLTPEGDSFAEACRVAMADGRQLNPGRIARITSCDQVKCAYEGRCP